MLVANWPIDRFCEWKRRAGMGTVGLLHIFLHSFPLSGVDVYEALEYIVSLFSIPLVLSCSGATSVTISLDPFARPGICEEE